MFGTKRSGPLGSNAPDFETDTYSVEVKTRKKLPVWLVDSLRQATDNASDGLVPLVILHEVGARYDNSIVVIKLDDFVKSILDVPEVID